MYDFGLGHSLVAIRGQRGSASEELDRAVSGRSAVGHCGDRRGLCPLEPPNYKRYQTSR